MQEIKNWNEVEAQESSFEKMSAGAYVCVMVNVDDVPEKEYLKIEYDVLEGKFAGEAKRAYERTGNWFYTLYRSYKSTAQGMFKAFTNAVEKSNDGYTWDWNESGLEGLEIGLVLQTEHYIKNNGDLGERLIVNKVVPADDVRDGKCNVPADKWTPEAETLKNARDTLQAEVSGTGFVVE